MAFVRAAAGWFTGQEAGPRRRKYAPPPASIPPGNVPPLEISGQVHRVPGLVSELTEALPAIPRTMCFPVDHTSRKLSHPRRGRVQGKN